jgi:hypothetical protein
MLAFAKAHPQIVEVNATNLCHECSRHFELLRCFDEEIDDFTKTEYFLYQKKNNKKRKVILEKIARFKALYKSISEGAKIDFPVITDDGCRLDGSHRCSVLVHLGRSSVFVNMVSYRSVFSESRSNKIKSQVKEYRKRVYQL